MRRQTSSSFFYSLQNISLVVAMYERIVKRLYNQLGFQDPRDIDIDVIADLIGVRIVRYPGGSMLFGSVIAVDERLPPYAQRADFFHEAAHFLLHDGNQVFLSDLVLSYQEAKADLLAMHLAAPDFMLEQSIEPDKPYPDQVPCLSRTFRLPVPVMRSRLDRFYRMLEKQRLGVV